RQHRHELPAAQRAGDAEQREPGERDEEAEHEDIAVREVDELDDAVHHRVPERDEGEDRAARKAVDRLLDEHLPPGHGETGGVIWEWGAPTWPPIPPNARSAPAKPWRS